MIIDHKPRPDVPSQSQAEASTSTRKLSIELPSRGQIYTSGSTVTGIVHLGSKELERIQEVQVSIVCTVRSIHHRYLGGSSHDLRRETTKLIHRDRTIWAASNEDSNLPPVDMSFEIVIPDVGNDRRAKNPNTPLPPSFHAGKRRGWKNMMTYGTSIGFIKYYAKAAVVRKGTLTRKERAFCPFIFLPPSPPPPLLPPLPESISSGELSPLSDQWCSDSVGIDLRQGVFKSSGHAEIVLWLPRVPSFPRLTPIPFVLCLTVQTPHVKEAAVGEPPSDILPPTPQLEKASIVLQQTIRSCARGGIQMHTNILDAAPTDNLLHGITPEEGQWDAKIAYDGRKHTGYWEKKIVWQGLWTFRETPNFVNRQLSWKYALIAEIPIKGLGNDAKLVSRPIEVSSGVTVGMSTAPSSEDMLDLPPDYFEPDGSMNDDDDDDEKS